MIGLSINSPHKQKTIMVMLLEAKHEFLFGNFVIPHKKSRFLQKLRIKDGKSLRNGMWLSLQNDIIMRNLIIYGKLRTEKNSSGKHALVSAAPSLAPI